MTNNITSRTSDHRFCELPKAFFKASTSLLSLVIVSLVLCFGDRPCIVNDPWLGLDVRSETFIIGMNSPPPLVEEEGDPVGVEITDNFDPPL
jgi:hypothetical protein